MKRKKLVVIVLALTVAMTMCFAGAESAFASTTSPVVKVAKASALATAKSTELTPGAAVTPEDINTNPTGTAFQTPVSIKTATYTYAVQVTAPEMVAISFKGATDNTYLTLYSDSGLTSSISTASSSTNSSNGVKTHYYAISSPGVYYMTFTCYGTSSKNEYANFEVQSVPMGGTLSNATCFYGSGANSNAVSYYQVSVPSTGYLTVQVVSASNSTSSHNIKLCNANKSSYYSDYEALYDTSGDSTFTGVKRGTYYIAVKSGDPAYGIKATFTKVKLSTTGTKKSKAKSIYKRSTKIGVLALSSKTVNWYKIKVTKTQKVYISINTKSSRTGNIKVTVYSKRNNMGYRTYNYSTPGSTLTLFTYGKGGKLTPGTYYIKVSKNYGGNGYYSIKWK